MSISFITKHKKQLGFIFLFIFISYFLFLFLHLPYDSEFHFHSALAKEILTNGFPHDIYWINVENYPFTAPSWLFSIILSPFIKFGETGLRCFFLLETIFLFLFSWRLLSIENTIKSRSFYKGITITILIFYVSSYIFESSPILISLILFIIESIILKLYISSRKNYFLFFLPLITVLAININVILYPFYLLLYVVIILSNSSKSFKEIIKTNKTVTFVFFLMLISLFINPYTYQAVFYPFKVIFSKYASFVLSGIASRFPLTYFTDPIALFTFVITFILIYLFPKSILRKETKIITIFSIIISLIFVKASFFLFLSCLFIADDVFNQRRFFCTHFKSQYIFLIIAVFIYSLYSISSTVLQKRIDLKNTENNLEKIDNYLIQENVAPNTSIYTPETAGSYFHDKGFNNIYFDSHPEFYYIVTNDNFNLFQEYLIYSSITPDVYNAKIASNESLKKSYVYPETSKWLDNYNFQYLIVDRDNNYYLNAYLNFSENYELIYKNKTDRFVIFKKKGNN